jgi:hypothetical protein
MLFQCRHVSDVMWGCWFGWQQANRFSMNQGRRLGPMDGCSVKLIDYYSNLHHTQKTAFIDSIEDEHRFAVSVKCVDTPAEPKFLNVG